MVSHKVTSEKGAAAVEFALLLPLLTLILFGTIIFGLIFNNYLEITHAAREGVRWAALRAPVAEVIDKAKAAAPGIDWTKGTVTVTGVPSGGATDDDAGSPVTVSVTYNIDGIKGIFGTFFSFIPSTISSAATQKVE